MKNNKTKALIIVLGAFTLVIIAFSAYYYKDLNEIVDPRVKEARNLYAQYNAFAKESQFDSVFWLMDTIESIYTNIEHYKQSYEVGVLYNNRAASYLAMALYSSNIEEHVQDSLINMAEQATQKSISIYTLWLNKFEDKSAEAIQKIISDDFLPGIMDIDAQNAEKFLKKRIKELQEAQIETNRRLSVSYTNLGIVYRHNGFYEEAAKNYKKAIELWDQNFTARNNLNMLLGLPLEKRNFIQKMFPPPKN